MHTIQQPKPMPDGWILALGCDTYARADGATLQQTQSGFWVIHPIGQQPPLTLCPYCDKSFQTPRAAALVADKVYPS